jgi:large subunit ribosomal protein L4
MKTKIVTLDNKAAGELDLSDAVFGAPVRKDILARMVNYQLAKRRAGTHKVKSRGEVSGSTAKPFRQKGTGRARQGSIRAAQMRGGGIVFGPVVREHAHKLPKKVRHMAMRCALSAKQADGNLVILDDLKLAEPKTKALSERLAKLGLSNVLIVGGAEVDQNIVRAARNIPMVDVLPTQGANVYDILRREKLALTRSAVEALEARLK